MSTASASLFCPLPCSCLTILGFNAVNQILRVMNEQSQPTFDEDFNVISYYNWTGGNGALSRAVPNGGNGEPKGYTGMVGTHHRPSDDISVFGEDRPPTVCPR